MGSASSRLQCSATNAPQSSTGSLSIDDFNHVPAFEFERGNYSHNYLVRRRCGSGLFAVKAHSKVWLLENDEVFIPRAEKEVAHILQDHPHPFVRPILAIFTSPNYILLVMPFSQHVDLLTVLQRSSGPLALDTARFYAAETCLALSHLHFHGILHRYLDLSRIRLQPDGHIKLTGFTICKTGMSVASRTQTFTGSNMAPELLLDKPYGFSVDWWAFGQVVYSMLSRMSVFQGEDEDEIYDAILSGERPDFPEGFDEHAAMLVNELLELEQDIRLGSGKTDAEEVMSHVFFRDVDWEKLSRKELVPPSIPDAVELPVVGQDEMPLSMVLPPPDTTRVLTESHQSLFKDFDFTADVMG